MESPAAQKGNESVHVVANPDRSWLRLALAVVVVTLYSTIFIARTSAFVPNEYRSIALAPSKAIRSGIDQVVKFAGTKDFNRDVRTVTYLVIVAGVIPLIATWTLRRRLRDVGTRWPNRYGLRMIVIAIVLATPFLVWMVNSPEIAKTYVAEWKRNAPVVFLACYTFNMLTEHFLIQGVILGFCHTSGRWPTTDGSLIVSSIHFTQSPGIGVRYLRWLGLAQPIDRTAATHPLTQWLGLPRGCLAAILTSALVFGLIHVGKDVRECILSFPGGLAIAYIAYRTDSWLTPFFIHASTAGIAFAMMYAGTT